MALTVFLASSIHEVTGHPSRLSPVLQSAGMEVIQPDETSIAAFRDTIHRAACSVHVLGRDYGPTLPNDPATSRAAFELAEARKRLMDDPDFKIFIWYPPEVMAAPKDPRQEEFINDIRNSIERNMIFSNSASPIQLVDDIRTLMVKEEKTRFDVKDTEVFLIFNQLDESQAAEIIDMISDILDVEKLNIIQDSDMDYSEYCSQQIGKSKLAVVYFKETSDWALPFTQQVWKKVGGAASHTPILLIGDDDPDSNLNKRIRAPKIISLIVSGTLIPLEIKVQYDKVVEAL